jgi:hypothetical protein
MQLRTYNNLSVVFRYRIICHLPIFQTTQLTSIMKIMGMITKNLTLLSSSIQLEDKYQDVSEDKKSATPENNMSL